MYLDTRYSSIFKNTEHFTEHFTEHIYALIFVCHNEETTFNSLQKWPHSFVIFVGSQPLTRSDSRIIVARDQPDNIEHNPKLLTFTAWYLIIKNNLFTEYSYLCIFEYDIMIQPEFDSSLLSLLQQHENSNTIIVGLIKVNHCFLCDVNQDVLHQLFPNVVLSPGIQWYATTNFCLSRTILAQFVDWYLPIIPQLMRLDLKHLSWYHERLVSIFIWEKHYTFLYLPNMVQHFFQNSHAILNREGYNSLTKHICNSYKHK